MIRIKHLSKSFKTQKVLEDLNLEISDGEMLAVVGPSGAGKSVLIKLLIGLIQPDQGEIYFDDCLVTALSNRQRLKVSKCMGVLFQGAALFDSLNLLENVAFPLRQQGLGRREAFMKASAAFETVNLLGMEELLPGEVTIGVKKRVGIARALVTKPKIILFDEPNTGLDPVVGQEIYDLIKSAHGNLKFTGIVISHEIPEVFQICDRVAMLYGGKIQLDCSPQQLLTSNLPVVKQFVTGDTFGPMVLNH